MNTTNPSALHMFDCEFAKEYHVGGSCAFTYQPGTSGTPAKGYMEAECWKNGVMSEEQGKRRGSCSVANTVTLQHSWRISCARL